MIQAVKISTGGVGGSQYDGHEYNLIDKVLYCSAVDLIAVHGRPPFLPFIS